MQNLNLKKQTKRIILLFSFLLLTLPFISQAYCEDGTESSIEQYGITWTFDKEYQCGQFVNGDYWVVDEGSGVKIINITPGDAIREGTSEHMNGSMLNPNTGLQGYDGQREYDAAKNVAVGVSPSTPLVLNGNVSLVSTISNGTDAGVNHKSYVKTASVLSCLSSIPPTGSFRPGISATTKTLHNVSNINHALLKSLPCPIAKPNIATYANYFQMVFLDHGDWPTRFMRPSDSGLDNYYFPIRFAEAELMLNLNYTQAEKQDLLINSIQLGIDLYSFIESGGPGWMPNGGNNNGRKWPIMFAGIMLNYAPMRDIGQKSGDYLNSSGYGPGNPPPDYIHFGEDGQTFYVAQSDVDITNGPTWNPDNRSVPNFPYTTAMIGMPEWGIRRSYQPEVSDSSWSAMYRHIVSGASAWVGVSMAVRIMGYKSQWNNPAFFDYMDRYVAIRRGNPDPFGYTVDREVSDDYPYVFMEAMWDTYRADYNSSDTTAPNSPTSLSVE
jgi:hypothetical protein